MANDEDRQNETGMMSEDSYDRDARENMTDTTTDTEADDSVL